MLLYHRFREKTIPAKNIEKFQKIRKAYHEYQNDPDFHFINGQAIIAKDDEWRNETEWDDIAKEKGISLE